MPAKTMMKKARAARVPETVLEADELRRIHGWWRACNYLSVGMIYLRDNALLREPLLNCSVTGTSASALPAPGTTMLLVARVHRKFACPLCSRSWKPEMYSWSMPAPMSRKIGLWYATARAATPTRIASQKGRSVNTRRLEKEGRISLYALP